MDELEELNHEMDIAERLGNWDLLMDLIIKKIVLEMGDDSKEDN